MRLNTPKIQDKTAKNGGDKMVYVVKSAVRGLIKGMRASDDFFKGLDALVTRRCKRAIERAKGNGRKTLRGVDV